MDRLPLGVLGGTMLFRILSFVAVTMGAAMLVTSSPAMAEAEVRTDYVFGLKWDLEGVRHKLALQDMALHWTSANELLYPGFWDLGYNRNKGQRLVSHFLKAGENELSIFVVPADAHEKSKLVVSLMYWKKQEGLDLAKGGLPAFRISLAPGQRGQPYKLIYDPQDIANPIDLDHKKIHWVSHKDSGYEELVIPFINKQEMPEWCWQKGEPLTGDDGTAESLKAAYREMHKLLEARNNRRLMDEWYPTLLDELASLNILPRWRFEKLAGFDPIFRQPERFDLEPFLRDENLQLRIGGNGRYASLLGGADIYQSPLAYAEFAQKDILVGYTLINPYFIRQNGEWKLCRVS